MFQFSFSLLDLWYFESYFFQIAGRLAVTFYRFHIHKPDLLKMNLLQMSNMTSDDDDGGGAR